MKRWPVQDAKARFSELLDTCITAGPQIVTRRGSEAAVLVSFAEWQRLQHCARPSLKDLLLADGARGDLIRPTRGGRRRRGRRPDQPIKDALIAATAAVHDLTIVTRNVRAFKPFGVPVFNPFDRYPVQ